MISALNEFCTNHDDIYVYGAGVWGKAFLEYLQINGFKVAGIITSSGNASVSDYCSKVSKASEVLPKLDKNDGVILAVGEPIQNEILNSVEFNCDYFRMGEKEFRELELEVYYDRSVFEENDKYLVTKIDNINWNEILVIQLEVTFGDMIWSTAFIRELRRNNPGSIIRLVINSKLKNLYEECPYINEIIEYDCSSFGKESPRKMIKEITEFKNAFLNKEYDAVFLPRLLPCGYSDAWENVLLGLAVKTKYRFGHTLDVIDEFKFISENLNDRFSSIVRHKTALHEAVYDLSMISAFGGSIKDDRMELWYNDEDEKYANGIIEKFLNKKLIAVAPVGSKEVRNWGAERYARVINAIIDQSDDYAFVILGGTDAASTGDIIVDTVHDANRILDLTSKTSLRQAMALIDKCVLYIGTDTGLMHMASAAGVPIVEVTHSLPDSPDYWGCSPYRTGPWKVKSIVIKPPKGLDECKYVCQRQKAHCICQIEEKQVIGAALRLLDKQVDN